MKIFSNFAVEKIKVFSERRVVKTSSLKRKILKSIV